MPSKVQFPVSPPPPCSCWCMHISQHQTNPQTSFSWLFIALYQPKITKLSIWWFYQTNSESAQIFLFFLVAIKHGRVWYGVVRQKWMHNTWERDKGKPETRVEMHCCTKVESVPKMQKQIETQLESAQKNSNFLGNLSPAPTTCQAECIPPQSRDCA